MSVALRSLGGAVAIMVALMCPSTVRAAQHDAAGGGISLLGSGPTYLDAGAGTFNIEGASSAGGKMEIRFGDKLWKIGPAIG
ncbi:MAG TPA: hypothetical protein VJ955_04450, partial [Desulfuromonadales bacterium]|nr:hypothetical protein [Desulfuromonadales bacterium]